MAVVLVAALLLLATSGLSLSRMTCLKGGFSVYTLGTTYADCSAGEVPTKPAVRAECCTFGQVVMDQPDLHHDRQLVVDVPGEHAPLTGRLVMSVPVETTSVGIASRPPPRPTDERRSLLRVYRV
jgi:hypothetical protein